LRFIGFLLNNNPVPTPTDISSKSTIAGCVDAGSGALSNHHCHFHPRSEHFHINALRD
jgi:hypothetical protein